MVKIRDNSLDAVAGLMILYMMFIHIGQPETFKNGAYILLRFFFFFMAWFYFKTGMFYRERSLCDEWQLGIKRIIIPIVCFTLFGQIVEWTKRIIQRDTNWVHYILSPIKELIISGYTNGNSPLWFLTVLLGVRIGYSLGLCFLSPNKKHDTIIFSFCLCVFLLLTYGRDNRYLQSLPLYFYTIPLALVFFLFARILKGCLYNFNFFLLSFIICVTLNVVNFNYVVFMTGELKEGNSYLMFIVMSICAIIVVNYIFRFLFRYYNFPLLTFVGRNSMAFFVLHIPILTVLNMVMPLESSWNAFILKVLVLGTIISIISCLKHKLNISWMFGE